MNFSETTFVLPPEPVTGHRPCRSRSCRSFRRTGRIDDIPIFLFSPEPGADNGIVYSRMFAPGAGIQEDPATGGACRPLGCYLLHNKVVTAQGAGAMLNVHGVKMGRPSYIHIAIGVVGEGMLYL